MRMILSSAVLCGIIGVLSADVPIDTSKLLKSNQAVVFDARKNTISYVLEIAPNGKITKKFLSNDEKQKLMKAFNLGVELARDSMESAQNALDSKASGASANQSANQNGAIQSSESKKVDKYPHSHIKEWDKSKIIYEQVVDKINILR